MHLILQSARATPLQEFDEDVVITLQARNPQAPQNIVRFDHTCGEYISIKLGETMIDHLEIEVGGACYNTRVKVFLESKVPCALF